MKFVGFKPRFDNYKLPDFLKSDMGLFRTLDNKPFPCLINSVTITREHTIPTEPVDSNIYVSDNIFTKPLMISLELYIYEQDGVEFNNLIETTQHDKEGFLFVNRDGVPYRDLYLIHMTDNITSDKIGGFDCSLELMQVMKVSALQSTTTKLPPQAQLVDSGQTSVVKKTPAEKEQVLESTAYKIFIK